MNMPGQGSSVFCLFLLKEACNFFVIFEWPLSREDDEEEFIKVMFKVRSVIQHPVSPPKMLIPAAA